MCSLSLPGVCIQIIAVDKDRSGKCLAADTDYYHMFEFKCTNQILPWKIPGDIGGRGLVDPLRAYFYSKE